MRVHYGRKSRPSGRLLKQALAGVEGRPINFGYGFDPFGINHPEAIFKAANKRIALEVLHRAGVPVPELFSHEKLMLPCVARPDKHRAGKGFWLCDTLSELSDAYEHGATHHMQYIEGGREFRVHVAFGKSIKLSEKVGGGVVKSFRQGATFVYPQDFNHKKSLRKWARKAVTSLGLDFGAVDTIYKDGKYYVLEVNTAPALTSRSDVLDRYVRAFTERSEYDETD